MKKIVFQYHGQAGVRKFVLRGGRSPSTSMARRVMVLLWPSGVMRSLLWSFVMWSLCCRHAASASCLCRVFHSCDTSSKYSFEDSEALPWLQRCAPCTRDSDRSAAPPVSSLLTYAMPHEDRQGLVRGHRRFVTLLNLKKSAPICPTSSLALSLQS